MEEKTEQNLFLYSKKRLEITGIADVLEFTENSLELALSSEGYLGIDGEDLKIDYFSTDSGKVCIHGNICGMFYYGKAQSSKKLKKHKS